MAARTTKGSVWNSETIGANLHAIFTSSSYRPPVLPAVALEIHELTRSPDVEFSKLQRLLEKDPVLAAKVVQAASSPHLSRGAPLHSLSDAVKRIGVGNLRDIVWQVALGMRVFRAKGYEHAMESVQRHSTATAHLARMLAERTSIATEYAFLCGLLHDVGLAATLLVLSEHGAPALGPIAEEIDHFHERGAEIVARLWRLPPDIQIVLGNHHHPRIHGVDHPLAALICVAEDLATELTADVRLADGVTADITEDQILAHAYGTLGFDVRHLEPIRHAAFQCLALLGFNPQHGTEA